MTDASIRPATPPTDITLGTLWVMLWQQGQDIRDLSSNLDANFVRKDVYEAEKTAVAASHSAEIAAVKDVQDGVRRWANRAIAAAGGLGATSLGAWLYNAFAAKPGH